MDLSRSDDGDSGRIPGPGRRRRIRRSARLKPSCQGLDGRQLLSTTAMPAALPGPPSTAVANAAADLQALSPATFAQLQADLTKAESDSHVTESQVGKLAQDEAALQQAIMSADLHPTTSLGQLDLQDVVAGAFRESPSELAEDRAPLDEYVVGVPGGAQLVGRTIEQMQAVSRATRTPTALRDAIQTDREFLDYDLGPNPDTDLGPGATDRDPLEVYFDGQVNNFIKA